MPDKKTIGFYALLIGIVVAGAWLRLRNLGADSIGLDEAVSWEQARGTLAELIAKTAGDNYPPLHNLLLYAFMNISGTDAEWLLRLPSALLGIANLVAVYWLGTLVGGRLAGIVAAALLAVSGMHVHYSQEARMYALLALAATLYAASSFYFIRSPTFARAALLAVSGLALVYSHPFGTLNWIAIAAGVGAYMLLTADVPHRGLVQWIVPNAMVVIGFLPWAIVLMGRSQAIKGNFWIDNPTPTYVYLQLKLLVGGVAGAALAAGAVMAFRQNPRASGILVVWLLGPILAALVLSVLHTPIFFHRYLIGGLPALAVLAGLGLAWLAGRPQWWTRVAAAALLGVAVSGSLNALPERRTEWHQIMAFLNERLGEKDCVLPYPAYEVSPLRYYLRRPVCTVLPEPVEAMNLEATGASRVFAVFMDPEFGPVRDKLRAFGTGGASLVLRRSSVVEYRRRPQESR